MGYTWQQIVGKSVESATKTPNDSPMVLGADQWQICASGTWLVSIALIQLKKKKRVSLRQKETPKQSETSKQVSK
jgi:hypothetical protein